mmetsp:Transcript_3130/g.8834  ORF Transcript_3130/g.8834 Transcript_3130/m.8834 type:complete len:325 (-) Transcript_3130:31-1005(-)
MGCAGSRSLANSPTAAKSEDTSVCKPNPLRPEYVSVRPELEPLEPLKPTEKAEYSVTEIVKSPEKIEISSITPQTTNVSPPPQTSDQPQDPSRKRAPLIRKFSTNSHKHRTMSVRKLIDEAPDVQQNEFWRSTTRVLGPEVLSSFNKSQMLRNSVGSTRSGSLTGSLSHDESLQKQVKLSMLTWDFDPFSQSPDWLLEAVGKMFCSEQSFTINKDALDGFLSTVRLNYHENPFHNWVHAFSVLQAAWMMLQCKEVKGALTGLDRLAVMIAALCHDIDHPGVNNDFLSKASHQLADHYPAPILENHHAAMTVRILDDDLASRSLP